MPYTDRWDTYKNGTVSVGLDSVEVIVGTGSLEITGTASIASQVNLVPTLAGGLPQPALRGKLRQTIRPITLGGTKKLGLAAVQSARNITTSGSAYLAYLDGSLLVLGKITAGLSGTVTVLDSVSFALVVNKNYVLELEWTVDIAQLGGVDLYAAVRELSALETDTGEDDFEESERQIHKKDTSSPLSVTLGNGPIYDIPASASVPSVRYDRTRIFAV